MQSHAQFYTANTQNFQVLTLQNQTIIPKSAIRLPCINSHYYFEHVEGQYV